jgi:hypothetical protein
MSTLTTAPTKTSIIRRIPEFTLKALCLDEGITFSVRNPKADAIASELKTSVRPSLTNADLREYIQAHATETQKLDALYEASREQARKTPSMFGMATMAYGGLLLVLGQALSNFKPLVVVAEKVTSIGSSMALIGMTVFFAGLMLLKRIIRNNSERAADLVLNHGDQFSDEGIARLIGKVEGKYGDCNPLTARAIVRSGVLERIPEYYVTSAPHTIRTKASL